MVKDVILAAIRGELGRCELPDAGKIYDGCHTVIYCPICSNKALDNHGICTFCGWEHDGFGEDHYSAANQSTLREYREQYFSALNETKSGS